MSTLEHASLAVLSLVRDVPDPEDVTQGWLGFVVFAGLALAVAFLYFSLRKQLGRVNFEEKDGDASDRSDDTTNGDNRPGQP